MSARATIAGCALFGDERLKILREFDAYVRAERAKGFEPSVAQFHALHGAEFKFSSQSLLRWIALRRRYGEHQQD
jgi:hypothetical protein